MVFTSKSYGATSQVEITANTTTLVGVGSGTAGQDVAGSIGELAPTQGVLNGGVPSSLIIGAGSDTFAIKVNGFQSDTIALTQNTYPSYDDLATEMQTRINADSVLKASGAFVTVTYDATTPGSEHMVITSKSFGASSQVELTANTTPLGLIIGKGVSGVGATGKGRELTSTSGDSKGLKLLIGDNVIGAKGTVNFSRGLIERLDKLMSGAVGTNGTFIGRTDGLQKSLANITKERTKLAARMTALETRLYDRFNKMDLLLGKMQATSSYLTQQFTTKSTN
jgi:flagellar hook-associated protein 2